MPCVDTQDWDVWRECFVPEALLIAHGFEQVAVYGNCHKKYVRTAQGGRIRECNFTRYYQERARGEV